MAGTTAPATLLTYNMMTRLLHKIQALTLIYLLGCSSFNNSSELWEGVSDNILRAVISEYIPYKEADGGDNIETSVKGKLDQRASLILASYIVMNLDKNRSSYETDAIFNNLMDEAIRSGKIINIDCSENNHCRAVGEYNISEILKKIESINE
ncbi:MAG: hypothetical protein FWG49_02210 [Leptospirales bacterium]|nr:hypothetical protein [Leptospirales bacterium]